MNFILSNFYTSNFFIYIHHLKIQNVYLIKHSKILLMLFEFDSDFYCNDIKFVSNHQCTTCKIFRSNKLILQWQCKEFVSECVFPVLLSMSHVFMFKFVRCFTGKHRGVAWFIAQQGVGIELQSGCFAGKKTKKKQVVRLPLHLAIKLVYLNSCLLWEFFRSRATL